MKRQFLDTFFFLCQTAVIHISCGFHRHLTLNANYKWQMTLELQYACPAAKNYKLLLLRAASAV